MRLKFRTAILCTSLLAGAVFTSFFASTSMATTGALPARFGLAPDNNQELVLDVINGARKQLLINIYQFDSAPILEAIKVAIRRDVTVKILIEGEPVAGITPMGKKIISQLQAVMKKARNEGINRSNRLFIMQEIGTKERRYTFNHAKYIVADQLGVYMSSENFTTSGHPTADHKGNRGWSTYLEDAALAARLTAMFKEDTSVRFGDIRDVTEGGRAINAPALDQDAGIRRGVRPFAIRDGQVRSAELISSPNSGAGLIRFMSSARVHLEVEQMSLPTQWKENGVSYLNVLVQGLMDAAARGVRVRALLNDETSFGGAPSSNGNLSTAHFLNQHAICEEQSIEARIVDINALKISYIHNKGLTADGARALVSSINGTRNSVVANRETALWLESADAAAYYGNAFDYDWSLSPDTPGIRGNARDDFRRSPIHQAACPERPWIRSAPILGYLGIRH